MGNENSSRNYEDPAASIFGKCSTLSDLLDDVSQKNNAKKLEDCKVAMATSEEDSTYTTQKNIEDTRYSVTTSHDEEHSQNDRSTQSSKYALSHDLGYLIPESQNDRCKSDPSIIKNSPPNRISSSLSSNHIALLHTSR